MLAMQTYYIVHKQTESFIKIYYLFDAGRVKQNCYFESLIEVIPSAKKEHMLLLQDVRLW